jgi:hypothetical protein
MGHGFEGRPRTRLIRGRGRGLQRRCRWVGSGSGPGRGVRDLRFGGVGVGVSITLRPRPRRCAPAGSAPGPEYGPALSPPSPRIARCNRRSRPSSHPPVEAAARRRVEFHAQRLDQNCGVFLTGSSTRVCSVAILLPPLDRRRCVSRPSGSSGRSQCLSAGACGSNAHSPVDFDGMAGGRGLDQIRRRARGSLPQ